jgi:hypothetical protein
VALSKAEGEKAIMTNTVDIFFAYAHTDEPLRNMLENHLSTLKQQGFIRSWHDQKVLPGQEWEQEAMLHLCTAHLILLLVSPDFLASNYASSVELKMAMERHTRGEAKVIPVILKPVDWKHGPLGKFQVLPLGGKPVTNWPNRDEGFLSVAEGIRKVVEDLRQIPLISLAKEKNSREQLHQRGIVETLAHHDEQGIQQAQQAMKLANAPQVSQSKYSIQIDDSKGIVIGDNTQVTQTFHEK